MSASDEEIRRAVSAHYGRGDLGAAILDAIRDAGGDPEQLTIEALAPFDHLHSGFHSATLALVRLAGLPRGARVLDVGGGIGGPARTLAKELDCQVTVLDATEAFCNAGTLLTERTGLSDRVHFRNGSALAMPFQDGSFDVVWMQNVGMNIAGKERLFGEIARVLRPGGRLVLQEVLAGAVQPAYYPMPWAGEASQSFLATPAELHALLAMAGLREVAWQDAVTAPDLPGAAPAPLLPILLYGEEGVRTVTDNARRNATEGRIRNAMVIAERTS